MKYVTLLLVLAALGGCSVAPRAPDSAAPDVREIKWTKGIDAAPFRDQHGVCHTFSQDHQGALSMLGEQLKACFERTLPTVAVPSPAGRGVKVSRQTVSGAHIDELFAASIPPTFLNAARRTRPAIFAVRGFYEHRGDTCHVVVADHADNASTFGHEFKHCVDGEFHDERGRWRQQQAGSSPSQPARM